MKAEHIIQQLQLVLPKYTNYFHEQIEITSLWSSGLTAGVTTVDPHGLSTGDIVFITGAIVPRQIINLTSVDGIASAETNSAHDQTQDYQTPPNVEIIGANEAEYNGTHELLTVPNRENFTYKIDVGAPATATGDMYILEDLKTESYNGYHEITVTGLNEFTYPLTRELGSPAAGDIRIVSKFRISGEATAQRAAEAYTKQLSNKLWAIVVLDDIIASKERREDTDATYTSQSGSEFRQMAVQQFHVYVFIPATSTIGARYARDICDDILIALNKSLLDVKFPAPCYEEPISTNVFVKSGTLDYYNSYYIHDFTYESTFFLQYHDAVDKDTSVAFRDISLEYVSSASDDGLIKKRGWVNLDDIPL